MLSKRIIACLDVRDGQVVKGINFEGLRTAGDPAELARRYNAEGIDELVILDITATLERRRALADTIRAVARELFIPLAVGGGIRTEADAAAAVEAGADKVSLNTAALSNPSLITTLAERYGSQAVLVAIDAKWEGDRVRRLRAQRTNVGQPRRGRVGARSRRPRRRRNPADVDRSRRHEGRLRLQADGGRLRRRLDSGHRVRRRRHARPLRRGLHARAAPTPRWPRRSFTTPKPACARSNSTCSNTASRCASESRMLIPSIDLQDGAVVQLVQGERLAIKDEDVFRWVRRFERFPKVQVIDLDAAMGKGDNLALVRQIAGALSCRVGGGIRTVERARDVLAAGARQIIAGLVAVQRTDGPTSVSRKSWPTPSDWNR